MNYIRLRADAANGINEVIGRTPRRKHRVAQRVLLAKIVGADNRRFQRTGEFDANEYRIVQRE